MIDIIKKLFTDHPEDVGETYLSHQKFGVLTGLKLQLLTIAILIHSIFPFLFVTTAGDGLRKICKEMDERDKRNGKSSEWW